MSIRRGGFQTRPVLFKMRIAARQCAFMSLGVVIAIFKECPLRSKV